MNNNNSDNHYSKNNFENDESGSDNDYNINYENDEK